MNGVLLRSAELIITDDGVFVGVLYRFQGGHVFFSKLSVETGIVDFRSVYNNTHLVLHERFNTVFINGSFAQEIAAIVEFRWRS
jgi:hypothetical protein